MNNVTGEQVKKAMIKSGITKFHFRDCSICKAPVFYIRENDILFFDGNCKCVSPLRSPLLENWDVIAAMINAYYDESTKKHMMKGFGLINGEARESKMSEGNTITLSIPFDSNNPDSEKVCIHDCSNELWKFMRKHRKEIFKGNIEIHMIIEKCTVMKDNLSFEFTTNK